MQLLLNLVLVLKHSVNPTLKAKDRNQEGEIIESKKKHPRGNVITYLEHVFAHRAVHAVLQ